MIATARKALTLLSRREKQRGALLIGMIIVMAVFETLGVASVVPFLAVLGDPAMVETNFALSRVHTAFGEPAISIFLFWLGIAVFTLLIVGAAIRVTTYYLLYHFVQMRGHSLSERLLGSFLRRPYAFFLDRHSGDLAKSVLAESMQVVSTVFQPFMLLLANLVTVAGLLAILIVVDPLTALIAFGMFGGLYALIYFTVRRQMTEIGRDRVAANKERFQIASDAFGGIKDIKILGRERDYLLRYRSPSMRTAKHLARSQTLSQVPRFIVEAVALGGIILFSLAIMARYGGATSAGFGQVLPVVGLYAVVGYRLLPKLQVIYQSIAQLRFGEAALDNVLRDLAGSETLPNLTRERPAPLPLRRGIALRNLSFSYPNAEGVGLHDITLDIPAGKTLGIVGGTGAGKSTLVDVILGLLEPTAGVISVDGTAVTPANLRAWQRNAGYVAQSIFLLDASVLENIAFGEARGTIDAARAIACARSARIHDFVTGELPNGYDTLIGERGVRLSGGQRQRLGIARALYHNPALLIFDEATSALDNLTEKEVMSAIDAMAGEKTILIIAHRLSTVRKCEKIIVLEKGRVVAEGRYDELLDESRQFRAIAEVG